MTTITARFAVDGWDEHDLGEIGGDWVAAARMDKTFTSGLVGRSTALFVSSGDVDGQRSYLAAERITGRTEDGREGSVTVHHGGLESSPEAWFGHVVPHSGTGDFAGWAGSARIHHDDGGAVFTFELDEPDEDQTAETTDGS